jgi:apoptosis-inducing factor 2
VTKEETVNYYLETNATLEEANKVLILGGGPVGVEAAAEIKIKYPNKEVTLVHTGVSHRLEAWFVLPPRSWMTQGT